MHLKHALPNPFRPLSRIFKVAALAALILLPFASSAQRNITLGRDASFRIQRVVNKPSGNFHSNVRPYLYREVAEYCNIDSLQNGALPEKWEDPFRYAVTKPSTIEISAWPTVLFQPGYERSYANSGALFRGGIGGGLSVGIGNKFYARADHLNVNGSYPQYLLDLADARNIIPGQGYARGTSLGKQNAFTSGYISYAASRHFDFQLGHGKNFWGDGYRSLLLSDVANNYSYFKGTGTVWKLKYTVLYMRLKDINIPGASTFGEFENKYSTAHYVSYNATSWLNISLFETVIWQARDTLNNRGYDVAYLNPIIFFRPVEYSRGSPDNSIVGASVRISPHKKVQLYGQIVLDEFLLAEIRAGNGWWANKQGIQLGAKYFDAFGLDGLHFQGEINRVRPFTYSHSPNSQNWAHFNQPLAHPLGANFTEAIGFARYEKPDWSIEAKILLADYGIDSVATQSVGQDVYRSYLNSTAQYGHVTGQGVPVMLNVNQLKFTWRLLPDIDLHAELGLLNRNYTENGNRQTTNMVFVGIRTALSEFYNDF